MMGWYLWVWLVFFNGIKGLDPAGPMEYGICLDLAKAIVIMNKYPQAFVACLPGPPAVV